MNSPISSERGSAMIMALGAISVLAVLALTAGAVVITEKRTGFAEYTGSRSFYSADAASESGVNWVKRQFSPAALVDTLNHVCKADSFTTTQYNNRYKFDVTYIRKRYRSGWSTEYKDYEYRVDATGASAQQSQANVELRATRLYREGY